MDQICRDALTELGDFTPVPWEMIPNFGLYMDQVITFLDQMYAPLFGSGSESLLSSSMINNYVKAKLLPRPTGKKYGREQIALLAMIAVLKQVSSMEDIRSMFASAADMGVEKLYAAFCARQRTALSSLSEQVLADGTLPPALDFAITAGACRTGCEFMLRRKL